jgi:hypothetical protein
MVRGCAQETSNEHEHARREWVYEGREYGSAERHKLPVTWLNRNHMGSQWRKSSFQNPKHAPGAWFRVAVLASCKQTSHHTERQRKGKKKRRSTRKAKPTRKEARELNETQRVATRKSTRKTKLTRKARESIQNKTRKEKCKSKRKARELDKTQPATKRNKTGKRKRVSKAQEREEQQRERERKRKRNRNRKRKRKRNRNREPRKSEKCTPGCLALAMRCMGLRERMHRMCDVADHSYKLEHFANMLQFQHMHRVNCKEFQILKVDPTKLYLVQAMAKHIHDDGHIDNTHSIAIFNKHIFDLNKKMLLLNRENLNACMLGGPEWVYSHASRAYEFTIQQNLQNKISRAFASTMEQNLQNKVITYNIQNLGS